MPILKKVEKKILGDRHNGGCTVILNQDGLVEKPRPCLAEWLFLSGKSPLRKHFKNDSLFSFFPDLNFYDNDLSREGIVDFLELNSNIPILYDKTMVGEAVGNLLGVSHWFGISDLHCENIKWGIDRNDNFILAPIDIECFFQDIKLPFQTGLVSKELDDGTYGLKNLIEAVPINPIDVIKSYLSTMKLCYLEKNTICQIIEGTFTEKSISRVLLKDTRAYKGWCTDINLQILSFLPEEIEQLKEGDIPYFFRELGFFGIKYWHRGKAIDVRIDCVEATILPQVLIFDLNKYWNEAEKWARYGALQIVSRLLAAEKFYSAKSSELEIMKDSSKIEIITKEWRVSCVL